MASDRVAACCLVFRHDGKVLAVSRKDDPNKIGFPGGKIDEGETAEEAAARELKEETGLVAVKLTPVYTAKETDGYTTTTFVACVEGTIHTNESGVVRWVEPSELIDPETSPFSDYNACVFHVVGLMR